MSSHHPIVPYISLCSGYEGIGLGLHRVISNLRCIAYCEREIFGAANLCAKAESGLLDPAPIFTDVHTFPWEQFAPFMAGGILSFGWPCQPVSHAGKRKATEDERWLFDTIADGIAVMRPGWLFAENVEGLLSARMPDGTSVFGHCITRLESLHYKVAAGIFSASEVGAPHQRKRVFILAYDTRLGIQGRWPSWIEESRPHAGQALPLRGGDAGGIQWPSRPGEQQFAWEPPRVVLGDAARLCASRSRPESSESTNQWWRRLGDADCKGAEQYDSETQSSLGGSFNGPTHRLDYAELHVSTDNRTDELRLLGNGVVPATAERAFRTLLGELMEVQS